MVWVETLPCFLISPVEYPDPTSETLPSPEEENRARGAGKELFYLSAEEKMTNPCILAARKWAVCDVRTS